MAMLECPRRSEATFSGTPAPAWPGRGSGEWRGASRRAHRPPRPSGAEGQVAGAAGALVAIAARAAGQVPSDLSAADAAGQAASAQAQKSAGEEAQATAAAAQAAALAHHNARGTSFFPGDLTWVAEQGPELIAPPTGSKIFPASQSARLRRGPVHGVAGSGVLKRDPCVSDPRSIWPCLRPRCALGRRRGRSFRRRVHRRKGWRR